jgi:quercetin dioxygenase-like cupin family protein
MPAPGDVIEHPGMGLRIRFVATGRETAGEVLRFEAFVAPGHDIATAHIHPQQEERTEVVSGWVRGRVAGEDRVAHAGDKYVAPPGTPHLWWNEGEEEAHLLVEMRPALTTDELLDRIFALGRTGRTRADGVPKMLDLAVVMHAHPNQFMAAKPPAPVQRTMLTLLYPLARALGRGHPRH